MKKTPTISPAKPGMGKSASPSVVFNPEDVSSLVDGWLMDMGVDKSALRPSSKVPNFGNPVTNNASPLGMFGLRPSGQGLGWEPGASSVAPVNMMDPLQRNIHRKLQLQQRAAARRAEEEAAGASSSSEDEDVARPGSNPSPVVSGKGKIKKVMKKGDNLMFFQGAHQSKALKKLKKKQGASPGPKKIK
eukprot:TRINITY_DN12868_c0_g1_i1.p1 TRINITY_DN12868_c0_g1~~TRINITY_DN12868_c0_g1_i1.p1  ORF type:complete len:189 (+),score=46.44 TRINITY_DN12868_c0_g1_i1:62-628(+)